MSKTFKNTGELIKEIRTKNNLSPQQLAEKLFVTRQTVFYWEQNKRSATPSILATIGAMFNEAILIKNNQYTILEGNIMENQKQLKLDFEKFDLEKIIKNHKESELENIRLANEAFARQIAYLEKQGYIVTKDMSYDSDQWIAEYCQAGTILSVEKDDRIMEIEVEKYSYIEIFDLDSFIKDISTEYGVDTANYVKKAICFSAYNLNLGEHIFNCFKKNKSEESILSLIVKLEGFEDIIHKQLFKKNYFVELKGTIFTPDSMPLAYRLDICDDFASDYVWIKLTDENGEERYQQESMESNIIVDALTYIERKFDDFDKLFEDATN